MAKPTGPIDPNKSRIPPDVSATSSGSPLPGLSAEALAKVEGRGKGGGWKKALCPGASADTFISIPPSAVPVKKSLKQTDKAALQSRRDIDMPTIEGQRSFLDLLYARFISFLIKGLIQKNVRQSHPPSDEQKNAITDVFEEYRILADLLGLPTKNLPGEDQIYLVDEDRLKTSHSGYSAVTMLGRSFLNGRVDLSVFINHLCHEVWHLGNPYRLVLVKKSYWPVGVDFYNGLSVKGLSHRRYRFQGLDEAVTEILAIMLRVRMAWRRMPKHLSLGERSELLANNPILTAGVGYPTQIAVALKVIDHIAERAWLNPKGVLIRLAASAASGRESHLHLLSLALSEEEIQLLSQMGTDPASAVPIAEKLGLRQIRMMPQSSRFYADLFRRAFEYSEYEKGRERGPDSKSASPIGTVPYKGETSMKSFAFPLTFLLFHGLQGEPVESTLSTVLSQPVADEAIEEVEVEAPVYGESDVLSTGYAYTPFPSGYLGVGISPMATTMARSAVVFARAL